MTNVMAYKGYKARIEYDGDDECFIGHLAGINDVVGFHATSGKLPERPFSGKVVFRIAPQVHADAVLAA